MNKGTPVRAQVTCSGMETVKAHPDALATALKLAQGDRTRIVVQQDGSVLVVNKPARRRGRATERR